MMVSKVGVLRDMVTGELEGVIILSLPGGEEIPCGIAVGDAQALLSIDWAGEVPEVPEGVAPVPPPPPAPPADPEDLDGPMDPNDKRAHSVPGDDGYGFVSTGTKVKVP